MTEKGRALLVLAILSPVVGEMLSGSSPPLEFFNPFLMVLLVGMYGAGAVLVREIVIRWRKGWASTIALGAAYGVIEEGIAVKSFFDPGWQDLGALAEYGRYLDVNWVWAFWLTIYHSAISICLPILLVALMFPSLKRLPLLDRRGLSIVASVFVVDITFCAVLFAQTQEYMPGVAEYALAFLVTAVLIVVAWRFPRDLLYSSCPVPAWRPWRFTLLGFLFILGSFVIAGSAPDGVHPVFVIAALLILSFSVLMILHSRIGLGGNELHKAHFAAGLMLLFILLSPVHEINGMTGMSVVGAAFGAYSYWLVRIVRGRMEEG
jgi:hypothetical protein